MPVDLPLPNVEDLSIVDRSLPPVTFDACGSCHKPHPWRLLRRISCALHNTGPCLSLPRVRRRVRYYDESSRTVALRCTDGLEAWELDRAARGGRDWTADYTWGLAARHSDSKGVWVAEVRLFISILAFHMQLSIPWRDGEKTRRLRSWKSPVFTVSEESGAGGSKYKASWCYLDNSDHPTWCAEVTLCHESFESLLAADDTDSWAYFAPHTCLMYGVITFPKCLTLNLRYADTSTHRAELDQRTGAGLYKKVVWYHRGVGYGNDLVECPVAPWDESMMEAYAAFVRPLMPTHEEAEMQGNPVDEE